MQTKTQSLIEAWANVAVGFGINFAANLVILPLFGYTPTLRDNFTIGLLYTGVSLARSYAIRRWFNGLKFKQAKPVPTITHSP